MSTTSPRATWPEGRGTGVHWIQARRAFERGSGAYPARIVEHDDTTVVVERISDRSTTTLLIGRPVELAAALARDDVTHHEGAPLALVSEYFSAIALATGPSIAPTRIEVLSSVTRFENGETVEIPKVDEIQPSWQLFAAKVIRLDAEGRPRVSFF